MEKKKIYVSPEVEILPLGIQNILEGSARTEDFERDVFDWDDDDDGGSKMQSDWNQWD